MTTIYDFEVDTADGGTLPLADYSGKVLLIVNVASKCGLTPQYEGLEALYRAHRDQGLEVLGFPCNQFKGQEPGTDAEIQDFCATTYDVTFPVLAKVDVNGQSAIPLYDHLRSEIPGDWGPHYGEFYTAINQINPPAETGDVTWNFTKFLVDREGRVVQRFEPPVTAAELEAEVTAYL